ncbi:hypothetical protein ACIBSW_12610 [Actinoplanes sp. NPDC049668]|uniref:Rv0361 family membrane protein n=1 Tax=unclassified Actinoplanes TaxID=2626549 RepID=UPI0033B58E2C
MLIIVGVVVVLCCGGLGVGSYFLIKSVKNATEPARQAAEAFVVDLERADVDGAYGLLCSDTQGTYTRETFADWVTKQPKIRNHAVRGVNVKSHNGQTKAIVNMALTRDSGSTDQHAFLLVQEDGAWKICGQPY